MTTGRFKIFHLVEATQVGVRQHVVTLLSLLNPDRYELTLGYSARRADALFWEALPKLRARGVKTVEIDMVREINPLRDFRALRKLLSEFHRNRYDIVQTHSAKAGFLGRLAARRAGVPVVIHRPAAWSFLSARSTLHRIFFVQLERIAARWCDRIVCVSRHERDLGVQYRIAPAEKFTVIPNGIDATTVTGNRRQARDTLNLPQNACVAGTITRFAFQKDPLGLLEALEPLLEKNPELFLVFIGDGPLRPAAERRAAARKFSHRVRFTGFRTDATALLYAFDVFLLPSRYEGLSYALLEAMAAELPIVTTRGGNEEAVRHGIEGLVVPHGARAELTGAVRQMIEQPQLRRQLGQNARIRVQEFNLPRQVAQTEALYDNVVREKRV